ncbi:MAG TPA: O-antigen ligase family protein [Candidatus Baltobacteraceae bacterium]
MQQVSKGPDRSTAVLYGIFILLSATFGLSVGIGATRVVAAIIFVVALFWLSRFWRIGVSALLLLGCFDGVIKYTHGSPGVFMLKDLTLLGILGGMLVMLAIRPERKPVGSWHGLWAWLLYVGYIGAQALNPAAGLTGGLAGFRAHAFFAFLFVVGVVYFTNPRRLSRTAGVAIVGITLAAGAGIFQFLFEDLWTSLAPGLLVASHKFTSYFAGAGGISDLMGAVPRAYGTMVDPAALGAACAVGFIFAAAALARTKGLVRLLVIVGMLTMGVALLFSGSRASAAGVAAGLIAFVILSWRHSSMRLPATIALVLVVLTIPLGLKATGGSAGDRFTSSDNLSYAAQTRAVSTRRVLASVPTHPFGMGLGATGAGGRLSTHGQNTIAVDNLYLATLYETGVPGLLIFLVLQLTILILTIRCSKQAASLEARSVYIGMAAAQIALLVNGIWSQGAFDYAPVSQIFWLFSGAVALPKRVEGEAG